MTTKLNPNMQTHPMQTYSHGSHNPTIQSDAKYTLCAFCTPRNHAVELCQAGIRGRRKHPNRRLILLLGFSADPAAECTAEEGSPL